MFWKRPNGQASYARYTYPVETNCEGADVVIKVKKQRVGCIPTVLTAYIISENVL